MEPNFKLRQDTTDEAILAEQKGYLKYITLAPDDVWLDAGACFGAFAINIASKVKRVIAYEPEQNNFKLLFNNIATNKANNIFISCSALVADDSKQVSFYLNLGKNMGAHSMLVKRGRQEVIVACNNINEVITQNKINKIKMDVEGAEYSLLKAIDFTNIQEIIFEFHHSVLKDKLYDKFEEIIRLIKANFNFVIYNENPKKNWHTLIYAKRI